MKRLSLSAMCFLLICTVYGQNLIEKICNSVCNCMGTIENMDSLQARLDRCIPESMAIYFNLDSDDESEYFTDTDTIKNTIDKVMNNLIFYCPKIKVFILAEKESQFYSRSDSQEANDYYKAGSDALTSKDFLTAEKNFLKAIKASQGWVLPYDDLGMTYRQMGEYKKAVKYYGKSLEIYPEGSFALQNQAVAYMYLQDYQRAIEDYNIIINLYPENPEGYFGKGKACFLLKDYEKALDYVLYCHKMYAAQNSEYLKDTEEMVSQIYSKMKEQNKIDAFNKLIEKHGIKIHDN